MTINETVAGLPVSAELRRAAGPLEQADFLRGAMALDAQSVGRAPDPAATRLRIFYEDFAAGRVEIKSTEPFE